MNWKVGQLSARTGISVRALHHYDAIGLLRPAARTGAGHRLYDEDDVRRLYRIAALRSLGMPLEEIGSAIDGGGLERTVRAQIARLDEQIALAGRLRERLARVLDAPTDELMNTIEVMTMYDKYYSPEQLEQLSQRREALGEDGMQAAEDAWQRIADGLRAAHAAGTDPADPAVQALIDEADGLIAQFTGGDPGIRESLNRVHENEDPATATHGMFDGELMEYMAAARSARG